MFRVVLIEPEIPWNTGNIGRTCLAVGAQLHIVGPMGYSLKGKELKRAGLDYWKDVQIFFHCDLEAYLATLNENPFYFFSAHGKGIYTDIHFQGDDSLVFGKESSGLGEEFIQKYSSRVYRIPVQPPIRSLNLSTAVGVVLYEAHRQFSRTVSLKMNSNLPVSK